MAIRHSFADMSKFTTQFYYSTAVKLLHCSITDTGTPLQPRSEKVLIWFGHTSSSNILSSSLFLRSLHISPATLNALSIAAARLHAEWIWREW